MVEHIPAQDTAISIDQKITTSEDASEQYHFEDHSRGETRVPSNPINSYGSRASAWTPIFSTGARAEELHPHPCQ